MKKSPQIDPSDVYLSFNEIEQLAYRDKVRFFEQNEPLINSLEFHEYFEMLKGYLDANFEITAYHKYIYHCDRLIEYCITEEIPDYLIIYKNALFKKAASYYNLMNYNASITILKELIKIDKDNKDYQYFLRKCYELNDQTFIKKTRAISMLFFLVSAFIISMELLVVKHFYANFTTEIISLRSIIFILAFVILISGEAWQRYKSVKRVRAFLRAN